MTSLAHQGLPCAYMCVEADTRYYKVGARHGDTAREAWEREEEPVYGGGGRWGGGRLRAVCVLACADIRCRGPRRAALRLLRVDRRIVMMILSA